jgi:nucleotide-binding universal stress UspA family protein
MRKLLIAVDNSDGCEDAVKWTLSNLYARGDELHLIHVVPRLTLPSSHSAPPIAALLYQDPSAYESLVTQAEDMVVQRALRHLRDVRPHPIVHLVQYEVDTDAVGAVVCKKAEEMGAAICVMARHNKSKLQQVR